MNSHQNKSTCLNLQGVVIRNGIININNSSNRMTTFSVIQSNTVVTSKPPADLENVIFNDTNSYNEVNCFEVNIVPTMLSEENSKQKMQNDKMKMSL